MFSRETSLAVVVPIQKYREMNDHHHHHHHYSRPGWDDDGGHIVDLSIYKPSMVSFLLENERVRPLHRYCVINEVRVSLFLPARARHRSEDD